MPPHYLVEHRCSKLLQHWNTSPASIGRASTVHRSTDLLNVDLVRIEGVGFHWRSSFWYTRTDVKQSLCELVVTATVNSFSSIKTWSSTVWFGYWFRSCRARVILACLLAAVSSLALIFFRHLSCSSFFTIRWTLDQWMPDSQSNCNKFQ